MMNKNVKRWLAVGLVSTMAVGVGVSASAATNSREWKPASNITCYGSISMVGPAQVLNPYTYSQGQIGSDAAMYSNGYYSVGAGPATTDVGNSVSKRKHTVGKLESNSKSTTSNTVRIVLYEGSNEKARAAISL